MKFALAGGGTGGHVYPAIAVAEELRQQLDTELVYYGTKRGPERDAAIAADIPFRALTASAIRGRTPARLLGGPISLWRGMREAGRYLDRDRPDAIFATGGYASAPIGRPAKQRQIPLVLVAARALSPCRLVRCDIEQNRAIRLRKVFLDLDEPRGIESLRWVGDHGRRMLHGPCCDRLVTSHDHDVEPAVGACSNDMAGGRPSERRSLLLIEYRGETTFGDGEPLERDDCNGIHVVGSA